MDLYREFRKTIRPLTIPDNDEDRNTQENFTTRNRPPREKETRKEEKREKARSIAACEA